MNSLNSCLNAIIISPFRKKVVEKINEHLINLNMWFPIDLLNNLCSISVRLNLPSANNAAKSDQCENHLKFKHENKKRDKCAIDRLENK